MLPGRKLPEPSLLRTHPHTHERIERLDKMADELQQEPHMSANDSWQAGFLSSSESKQPRWHVNGLWF